LNLDSLKSVLGLAIGLAIPARLGVIGPFIYLFKLIQRKKTKVIPIKYSNRHHHSTKQTDIYLKKQPHHH
jgi:hypothetical protein